MYYRTKDGQIVKIKPQSKKTPPAPVQESFEQPQSQTSKLNIWLWVAIIIAVLALIIGGVCWYRSSKSTSGSSGEDTIASLISKFGRRH